MTVTCTDDSPCQKATPPPAGSVFGPADLCPSLACAVHPRRPNAAQQAMRQGRATLPHAQKRGRLGTPSGTLDFGSPPPPQSSCCSGADGSRGSAAFRLIALIGWLFALHALGARLGLLAADRGWGLRGGITRSIPFLNPTAGTAAQSGEAGERQKGLASLSLSLCLPSTNRTIR